MPFGAKAMGCITHHYWTAIGTLQFRRWSEKMLLRLNYCEHAIIVTYHASHIHRHYNLGALSYGICQLVVVHLYAVSLAVHHHHGRTYMYHGACRSRICICRNHHLVTRTNTKHSQGHLHGSRRTVECHCRGCPTIGCHLTFELLCLWSRRNPSRP